MRLTFITATLPWSGTLPQLIPQIQAYLHPYGIPLRWAITAVTGQQLTLEAVVLQGEFNPTPTP